MIEIHSHRQLLSLIEGPKYVLVDFMAPWCKNCKKLAAPLTELAQALQDQLEIAKVDTTVHEFAVDMGVSALPHLMLYTNGVKVDEFLGSNFCELKSKLSQHLGTIGEVGAVASLEEKAHSVRSSMNPVVPNAEGKWLLNVAFFAGGIASPYTGPIRPASEVATDLQRSILGLYADFISDDGESVDYDSLRTSERFSSYVAQSAELQVVDVHGLAPVQLKALFLNLYNALCIHGYCTVGAPDITVKGSLGSFFGGVSYLIGGQIFSLDDMEHGVLRGNQIHPTSGQRFFGENDNRAQLALSLDPRVHCALVCGAKSCPPIRIFDETNLDTGLMLAAKAFCESEVVIDVNSRTITTSKIFMWYGSDFGATEAARVRWLADHVSENKRDQLLLLVEGETFTLAFKDYDWTPNSK